MSPFKPAELDPNAFDVSHVMKTFQLDSKAAEELVAFNRSQRIFLNDKYQVNIRDAEVTHPTFPAMHHLSVKRIDKAPIHDWRDLYEIKNALVGSENEALELYPAESRLVDSANQYHLWVFKDDKVRAPFGFGSRFVMQGSLGDSVQRPFE